MLAGRIMVGVTRMEPQFRIAADSLSTKPPARLSASTSRQVVVRPHRLDATSGQVSHPTLVKFDRKTQKETWERSTVHPYQWFGAHAEAICLLLS